MTHLLSGSVLPSKVILIPSKGIPCMGPVSAVERFLGNAIGVVGKKSLASIWQSLIALVSGVPLRWGSRRRRRTRGKSGFCCRCCRASWRSRWSGTSRWRRKSPAAISSRSSSTRSTSTDTSKSPSCSPTSRDSPVRPSFKLSYINYNLFSAVHCYIAELSLKALDCLEFVRWPMQLWLVIWKLPPENQMRLN